MINRHQFLAKDGFRWIAAGTALGLIYSVLDAYFDGEMGAPPPVAPAVIEWAHTLMDHVLPLLTGALFGVFVHYLKIRQRVLEMERQRADELSSDLHKLERDQAVWVISASLLHELKTPLHALGLLLDEMAELSSTPSSEYVRLLERARAQSERLVAQVDTLRLVPGTRQPELPVHDLLELVQELSASSVPLLTKKNISLRLDGERIQARVQPVYLRIVLENLIRNAAGAFEDERNHVISVQVLAHAQVAHVVVQDDGPGLSPDASSHLFAPLHTTKPGGMGLGLAITRGILRSMGGDIWWEPSVRGARFVIQLSLS